MTDEPQTDFIPVIEETVSLSKRTLVTGRVRVSTQTETVEDVLPVELSETEVEVVRVPMGRKIDSIPEVVNDGDLTIIPVVEERLVVVRELYLREEVHIRRRERREILDIPVTTRSQTVHVERLVLDPDTSTTISPHAKDNQNDL